MSERVNLAEVPRSAGDLSEETLQQGQQLWATVDSPWLHRVDRGLFAKELDRVRSLDCSMILSSHLPVAQGKMTERMLASLEAVPGAPTFVGPDQAALEQMLAQMPPA